MGERYSLGRRVSQAFFLQLILISATAVAGSFAARWLIEDVLVRQALEDEAEHFWNRAESDPAALPPDTRNLKGYVYPGDARPPDWPYSVGAGAAAAPDDDGGGHLSATHTSQRGGRTLYLRFTGERVGELAVYFGVLPLAAVLVVLYSAAWITYRRSRDAISPIVRLAQRVERMDPQADGEPAAGRGEFLDSDGFEVRALASALDRYSRRIQDLIERERNLTRDASHELRSPISVVKMASRALEREDLTDGARRNVDRIARAASDMEELTETFLLLARENELGGATQTCSVNDAAEREASRARELLAEKPVAVTVEHDATVSAPCSGNIMAVLIGNLVRNAVQNTASGSVALRVSDDGLSVEDTGCGIDADVLARLFEPYFRPNGARGKGFGIGLSIVHRLCHRFGWRVSLENRSGGGARAKIELNPGAIGSGSNFSQLPGIAGAPGGQ